ncbi:MAG TPA: DNA-binding response regulator [Firmicutes bacterium]|nr:DNA-binding response regulator [Bacillota bacterium]
MATKDYLIYSLEDDPNISHLLDLALSGRGYRFRPFLEYPDFKKAFENEKPNMILLDLMLPVKSGEEILKEIRMDPSNDDIQIIIISAKNLTINKIDGLDLGADDYICKPFDVMELISRVNARARRYLKKESLRIRSLSFDFNNRVVKRDGTEIHLTQGESTVLFELAKNVGKPVTRETLYKALWGDVSGFETRTLDVHVKEIRRKLSPDNDLIETVYGLGYKLKDE